jgi:SPP1 family predicted phage head-tail adaptor
MTATKKTGAGELTEQLTIRHLALTDDGQGGHTETWTTLAKVFGQMIPLSASESLAARAVQSTQTYTGKIYYRPDITPLMRVQWTPYRYTAPKELEIHGVLPDRDEPRRFLLLDLGEVADV